MPGLLTIKTDLKSLKYGQDQPGGGSSGQPFIQTDINTVDSGFNKLRLTKFDDGLVRGGIVGAANSAATDTIRITKFLTSAPQGPLFIAKQVGLQLSNPRLEIPKNPFNIKSGGLDNTLAVGTKGVLEPTRIYNLGINTLLQVPLNAIGSHISRHGLLPVQSDASKYEAVVTANNDDARFSNVSQNNRLVSLAKTFKLGDKQINNTQTQGVLNTINTAINAVNTALSFTGTGVQIPSINFTSDPEQLIIDQYSGGPGSTYGILGDTTIRRSSFTEDGYLIDKALKQSSANSKNSVINLNKNLSRDTAQSGLGPSSYPSIPTPVLPDNVYGNAKTYNNIMAINGSSIRSATYNTLTQAAISLTTGVPTSLLQPTQPSKDTYVQFDIVNSVAKGNVYYSSKEIKGGIEYKNRYGDVVVIGKKSGAKWSDLARETRIGSGKSDSINLTPLFTDTSGLDRLAVKIGNISYTINDLVKFRIEAIDTDNPKQSTFMVFRAYITNFDDSVNANWDATKYIGRGEEFYIYNGFTRKINIGFKVAALSAKEMQPMYNKLNYLMSNLMPDYNDKLMRGPFMRMTVGNWIDSQPGVINSLTYTISNDSPWEIALNEPITSGGTREMVLPHIVDVSLSFTPVGVHTKGKDQTPKKSNTQTNIAQNYNGNNEISNYVDTGDILPGQDYDKRPLY